MYKGEADWSLIAETKNNSRLNIPVFGNGDIDTAEKAKMMKDRYAVDGMMIGRASIGYPWIFNEIKHYLKTGEKLLAPTIEQRVAACKQHLERALEWKGPILGVVETRRHYTNYFKSMFGIKEYRKKLVTTDDPERLFELLNEIEQKFSDAEFL